MLNYLTYSRISSFLQCPFRYKWQYLDKKEYPESKALAKGIFVHTLLERYGRNLVSQKKDIDIDYFEKQINWLWENIYKKVLTEDDYKNVREMVLRYIDKGIDHKNIMGIEQFFDFYISDLNLKVKLKVDRLDKINDGKGIKIIDYKTGTGSFYDSEDLQQIIYSYAIQDIYRVYDSFELEWIYLESGAISSNPVIEKEKAKQIIIEKAKMVLDDTKFEPKRNNFCKNCHIKEIGFCELFK